MNARLGQEGKLLIFSFEIVCFSAFEIYLGSSIYEIQFHTYRICNDHHYIHNYNPAICGNIESYHNRLFHTENE